MTQSLLQKQPQIQNTQDAAAARSEEVGNFATNVASKQHSRIWAAVRKHKKESIQIRYSKGRRVRDLRRTGRRGGRLDMSLTGNASGSSRDRCAWRCPFSLSGHAKSTSKIIFVNPVSKFTASLSHKEILNYVARSQTCHLFGNKPLGNHSGHKKEQQLGICHHHFSPVASVILFTTKQSLQIKSVPLFSVIICYGQNTLSVYDPLQT